MKPSLQVSRPAIALIKGFEGLRRSAARLADGRWTIGYGHTKFAREGVEITEKDAEALLIYDLIEVVGAVNDLVFSPVSQNQFDALVSFASNIGIDNFRTSAVLRRVNEGELIKAAFAIETWRRADFAGEAIVIDALVRRRAAEKALFLTPEAGFVPAPTPVLPPKFDPEAAPVPPGEALRRLITPLDGDSAEPFEAKYDDAATPFPSTGSTIDALTSRLRELVPDREPEPEPEAAPVEPVLAAEEPVAPFPDEAVRAEQAAEPAQTETPPPPNNPVVSSAKAAAATVAGVRRAQRAATRPRSAAPTLFLGAAGVFSFGLAIFLHLNRGGSEAQAANAQGFSYLAGIIGVGCIFVAAYLVLERLAGDDA